VGGMKRLNCFFDRILNTMAIVAGALLAFSVLSVSLGVASRYFFNYPVGWITEICSYILLYVTFLAGAWVLREEGHVSIDVLINHFGRKTQSLINLLTSVLNAAVCLILTYYAGKVTLDLYKTDYFTPTELELPKWTINIVIVLGSASLFIQFIRCGIHNLSSLKNREKKDRLIGTLKEYDL